MRASARSIPLRVATLGHMLYKPGTPMRHAYFHTDSIVSLRSFGNEGVVGIFYLGAETPPQALLWCKPQVTPTEEIQRLLSDVYS